MTFFRIPQASFRTASAESLLKLLTMTAPCFNRTGQLGLVRHTRDVTSRPLALNPSLRDAIKADARSSQPHSVRLVSYCMASPGFLGGLPAFKAPKCHFKSLEENKDGEHVETFGQQSFRDVSSELFLSLRIVHHGHPFANDLFQDRHAIPKR